MFPSHRFEKDAIAAEIVICDLGLFQILVPTEKQWSAKYRKGSSRWSLPIRRRIYRDRGWIFYHDQIIGGLSGLRLNPLAPASASIPSKPITMGQPISFEMSSQAPIPEDIAQRALFLYQFNSQLGLHYALLQNLIPQFVRIYPFRSSASLVKLTRKFLQEEKAVLGG